jgi:RNA polymerase sigma-32 factor
VEDAFEAQHIYEGSPETEDHAEDRDLDLPPGSTEITRYDPLKRYLLEISKYSALDRDEEHRLAALYHETGDREAAYRLVTAHLKLVIKIAMIYRKIYKNILDLVQEGNLGLIQAVRRFDPDRGTRLTTYATWWIKAYILKFLLDNTRLVKIGTTNARRKVLMHLSQEKRALEAKGIVPTAQVLAHNLGVEESDVLEVEQGMSSPEISLDSPVGGSDGGLQMMDTLHLMEESIDEKIAQGEFRHMLEKKFEELAESLTERERTILNQRLIAEEPQTLQQIADTYGVTREAIRVAENKLIAKIKRYMIDTFGDIREIEFNLRR